MNKTSIEWCRTYAEDGTFTEGYSVNPVRFRPHGSARTVTMCQKVSPGCANCYAEGITRRFWPKDACDLVQIGDGEPTLVSEARFPGYTAAGVNGKYGQFELDETALQSVLKHRKPGKVFWGDMTDLFGEWVKDEWLDSCFAVMALTPQLTHIVLTKRPERMQSYLSDEGRERCVSLACVVDGQPLAQGYFSMATGRPPHKSGGDLYEVYGSKQLQFVDDLVNAAVPCTRARWFGADFNAWPLPNVWLGVSVEEQATADERIPLLLQTPAAVRFISAEPLLGLMDLEDLSKIYADGSEWRFGCLGTDVQTPEDDVEFRGVKLDWVICGGESGPKARPMHPDWARSLRDQCQVAAVPFFFKQWGESLPFSQVRNGEQREAFAVAQRKGRQDYFGSCIVPGPQGMKSGTTPGVRPESHAPIGKKVAGRLLDGREWNEFAEGKS